MKVGEYVRTNDRGIRRIGKIIDDIFYKDEEDNLHQKGNLIKSSQNKIDLIEVGDVIRGKDNHLFEVYAVGSDCVYINNLEEFILIKDIKGITTKEQFSQMEYRIGE